jgi:hypothetical protein
MTTIHVDAVLREEERRRKIYSGDIFVAAPSAAGTALCAFARTLIEEAFAPLDPRLAHEHMPVERCVDILAALKPRFIHHPRSQELVAELLRGSGCDVEDTYFDVPRLRSAMPASYLTSGIAYAFHPHRDTWYSAPPCQINWWLPVYEITAENCMAFHPRYWSEGVRNSSRSYDYRQWQVEGRASAVQHIKTDTRLQPRAEERMDPDPQFRLLIAPGATIAFSAAQMHSTVPNLSGMARWSIDFRSVSLSDARARRGACNVDSACTGTTMRDYLRVNDFSRLPDAVVALYDDELRSGTATAAAAAELSIPVA